MSDLFRAEPLRFTTKTRQRFKVLQDPQIVNGVTYYVQLIVRHFVVVEGIKNNQYYTSDGTKGTITTDDKYIEWMVRKDKIPVASDTPEAIAVLAEARDTQTTQATENATQLNADIADIETQQQAIDDGTPIDVEE